MDSTTSWFPWLSAEAKWRCRPLRGHVNEDQAKLLIKALHWNDKSAVLRHISELATAHGRGVQDDLLNQHVTQEVIKCFMNGTKTVQGAAAQALATLCKGHDMNCRKVLDGFGTGWFKRHLMEHASRLMCGGNAEQVFGVVSLLRELALEKASEMLHLHHQKTITEIVKFIPNWSRRSRVPTSTAVVFLEMLPKMFSVFNTLALCGGAEFCHKLHKANLTAVLLELVAGHSQVQQMHQEPTTYSTAKSTAGSAQGHEAVVNSALALLTCMMSQVPAQRLDFEEMKGVQWLLRLLNDEILPLNSSVQGTIVKLLTVAASSSPKIAESVQHHGLATIKKLLMRYLCSWLEVPSGSSMVAYSSSAFPLSPAPCSPEVVGPLLQLFTVVAPSCSTRDMLADGGLQLLEAALRGGLANVEQDGHKVATAAAQALLRLSCNADSPLDPTLCGGTTISLMAELVDLACERTPITTVTDGQIVHGGVCAQGFLSKVLDTKLRRGEVSKAEVLSCSLLPKLAKLLCRSTEAVLVAANVPKAQYLTPVGSKRPAPVPDVCCAGHAYLAHKQVEPDMQVAVPLVLQLLTEFSQEFDTLQVLRAFKMEATLGRLALWQETKPLAARLLIAEAELEYQPYHLYGKGMLQAAVLRAVQLDPRPFDEKGVSAAKLLKLSAHQLKTWLGLDPTEISRVVLIQEANQMFGALDKMSRKVDGCIVLDDLQRYLVRTYNMREENAESFSRKTFDQMQVDPRAPASFLDFVKVFACLKAELEENTAECRATKRCRR